MIAFLNVSSATIRLFLKSLSATGLFFRWHLFSGAENLTIIEMKRRNKSRKINKDLSFENDVGGSSSYISFDVRGGVFSLCGCAKRLRKLMALEKNSHF